MDHPAPRESPNIKVRQEQGSDNESSTPPVFLFIQPCRPLGKIAMDFEVQFKRKIDRTTVGRIIHTKESIKAMLDADPELDGKNTKHVISVNRAQFEADLHEMIKEKYKSVNITYEVIRLCAKQLQETSKYRDAPIIQKLQFCNDYITQYMKKHLNDLENALENPTQKKQIQSKITLFFSGKK